ncbi:MAG: RNA-binding protein [Micrococcus sp.]|nr:RNA-binding protein [Micrococcus sp.]
MILSSASTTPPLFWRAEDLPDWHAWQRSQWPASRRIADIVRTRVRTGGNTPAPRWLLRPTEPAHTVVALESYGPTQMAALSRPVKALATLSAAVAAGVAWIVPSETPPALPGAEKHVCEYVAEDLSVADLMARVKHVLVAGEYLPSGARAVAWAREHGARVNVVQHGLLANSTPPMPAESRLFAFTEADAAWWTYTRTDVEVQVVGSTLLRDAAGRTGAAPSLSDDAGIFLGQLHGAELPRKDLAIAAETYIQATGARYRPHPAEQDRLSRGQHERWRRAGVQLDDRDLSLAQTHGPVASVFSTGVLEAAQTGRPAYVVHPDPPAWLEGFWERYGMSRWRPGRRDVDPTPPLIMPDTDPAVAIAQHLWKDLTA